MFWEYVTVTAAIAAVAVTGASDMPQPGPRGLDADPNGLTNDNTDASRIADSEIIIEQQKSMAEQSDLAGKIKLQATSSNISTGEDDGAKTLAGSDNTRAICRQIKKCSKQGGRCVSKGTCNGILSKGCKNKCDCCIEIETTSAPPTTSTPVETTSAPPTTSTPGSYCVPNGGVIIGGRCLTFHEKLVTWSEAVTHCAIMGGQLASLSDPIALLVYKNNKYGDKQFWVGGAGSGHLNYANWFWITGKPFDGSFPWAANEPSGTNPGNGLAENCLMTWYRNGYNDGGCDSRFNYICDIGV